jgi:hypothetical protein
VWQTIVWDVGGQTFGIGKFGTMGRVTGRSDWSG